MQNTSVENDLKQAFSRLFSSKRKSEVQISPFELVLLAIVTISIASILLLILNRFKSVYAIITGVGLAIILFKIFNLKITFNIRKLNIGLLLIIFLALFFRAEPYLYQRG